MENIRLAFQGIWGHKLRSFLTMLGIIIGIAAIMTIVSTIKGTNEQIKQNLIGAGNNVVTVQLHNGNNVYDMSYNQNPKGVAPIQEEMRGELEKLDGVKAVSFYRVRPYSEREVFYHNTSLSGRVCGIDKAYFQVEGYRLTRGRGFVDSDYESYRKVAIVDEKAAASLFDGAEPVGQTLEIKGETFTVVGVVASTSSFKPNIKNMNDYYLYAETTGGSVYMPDSVWPVVYRFDEPQSVAVQAYSTDEMTVAGKAVADKLTETQIASSVVYREEEVQHDQAQQDPEIMTDSVVDAVGPSEFQSSSGFSYRSEDLLEQAQKLQDMSSATNNQLIWIASISLLVGGIGVMNIMLVSVTERTSEIGLKKALGAKRRRILWQFLTEAAVLTCLGGLLGVLSGVGTAQLISKLTHVPVSVSIPATIIAVAFSTLIGVLFGLLPAAKAANLSPIRALRRD